MYLFKIEISLFIKRDDCISRQMQEYLFEIQTCVLEIEIYLLYVEIEKSAFKFEISVFQ